MSLVGTLQTLISFLSCIGCLFNMAVVAFPQEHRASRFSKISYCLTFRKAGQVPGLDIDV